MTTKLETDESPAGGAESALVPIAATRYNVRAVTKPIPMNLPTAELAVTLRPTLRLGKGNATRSNAASDAVEATAAGNSQAPIDTPAAEVAPPAAGSGSELSRTSALDSESMTVAERSGNQLGPGDYLGDGRYRLVELLSDGSMARVFKAVQLKTERIVVVKVLLHAGDSGARKAAKRELNALVRVNYPSFVIVLDADVSADHTMWIATEYVSGETLRNRITRGGRLLLPEALDIMIDVFDGLSAAHDAKVLHLDLKPENILLGRGFTKICDLGTAALLDRGQRTTDRGSMVATPEYIAPERLVMTGEKPTEPDFRCDLYSAGLCLYETIAGFHALIPEGFINGRRLAKETMCLRHVEFQPAVLASIPTPLWELIDQLIRKDPAERPPSAGAVAARLREIRATLHAMPADLEPAPAEPSVWAKVARSLLVGIAAGLVALAAIAGGLRTAAFLRDRQSATEVSRPAAATVPQSAPQLPQGDPPKPAAAPTAAVTASAAPSALEHQPAPLPVVRPHAARPAAIAKVPRAAVTAVPLSFKVPWFPRLEPDDAPVAERRSLPATRPTVMLPKPQPKEISDKVPF